MGLDSSALNTNVRPRFILSRIVKKLFNGLSTKPAYSLRHWTCWNPLMASCLNKELNSIIDDIEKSAKTARLISLNAGVIAVRTRAQTDESYAFEAIADQIKEISEKSVSRLGSLRSIISDLRDLTRTINIAGRQRMISQRVMKLYAIERLEGSVTREGRATRDELQALFGDTLGSLKKSRLCDKEIWQQLDVVENLWNRFLEAMDTGDVREAIHLNDEVLVEMNRAVVMFEDLGN